MMNYKVQYLPSQTSNWSDQTHSQHRVSQAGRGEQWFCTRTARQEDVVARSKRMRVVHSQLPIAGRFSLQDWTTVYGEELYNHSDASVPNSYDMAMETVNIAGLASARATVADLKAQLIAFNTPT